MLESHHDHKANIAHCDILVTADRPDIAPHRDRQLPHRYASHSGLLGSGSTVPALSHHWRADLWAFAHRQNSGDRVLAPAAGTDPAEAHHVPRAGRTQAAAR